MTNKDVLISSIAAQKKDMQAEFDATSALIEKLPADSALKSFAVTALEKIDYIIDRLNTANELIWKEDPAALEVLNACIQDSKEYQIFLQGMPQQ